MKDSEPPTAGKPSGGADNILQIIGSKNIPNNGRMIYFLLDILPNIQRNGCVENGKDIDIKCKVRYIDSNKDMLIIVRYLDAG